MTYSRIIFAGSGGRIIRLWQKVTLTGWKWRAGTNLHARRAISDPAKMNLKRRNLRISPIHDFASESLYGLAVLMFQGKLADFEKTGML